jgi:mycoredoxin
MADSPITVYGAEWCGDCQRAVRFFKQHHIAIKWIDVDVNPEAAQYVKSVNHGNRSVPTIVFEDGSLLVEPSTMQLEQKVKSLGLNA